MIRSIIFIFVVLLNGVSGCSHADDSVYGHWRYVGTVGKSIAIECPDVLVLESVSSYYVLNDCYGSDVERPITEYGVWTFDKNSSKIILSERTFKDNYHLINSASSLGLKILKLTNKEMILLPDLDDKLGEVYERLPNKR